MNDVFVTCIKNGRFDQFGRPLVSGSSYTLSWSLARDLWLSGYVSVTDTAVFDSSSVDVRRPNLAAELAAISAPVPLWVCGMPFVLFAGDGGANGMLFTGTAGGFTLSAAVLTGFVIPVGYCYLPANAGGLGNAAGWFYFEMSSETAGIVYNNAFSPVVGAIPIVPGVKTPFANPVGGRITQTTADVTMLSCSLAAGAIGKNGSLRMLVKRLASATATSKGIKIYADATLLYTSATSSCNDFEAVVQNAGVIDKQISTRAHAFVGQTNSSISADLSSFDFSNSCTLSITANLAVNTDSVLHVPRSCILSAKD